MKVPSMRKFVFAALLAAAPLAFIPMYASIVPVQAATVTALGDLSNLSAIVTDTLTITRTGDLVGAEKRITDFETAWDQATGTMQPLSPPDWGAIDTASDRAIEALRAAQPNQQDAEAALAGLIAALDNPTAGAAADTGAVAVAAAGTALVVTNADGSPLPCEVALKAVRDLNATKVATDQAKYDKLVGKGLERCNADDDKRADAFFAEAYALMQ